MIVFGGVLTDDSGPTSNEVCVIANANGLGGTPNWTQLNPTAPAPERAVHSVILNAGTNRMTMFGGHSNITLSAFNETWVLTIANGLCQFALAGDSNDDCRFDLSDFAMMAASWLVDCGLTPGEAACVPE